MAGQSDFIPPPDDRDHEITLKNRESGIIRGVLGVESFDDREVILDTEMGLLTVRGEDLHIRELSLEKGSIELEGMINGVQYSAGTRARSITGKGKGFIQRLLR